mmetsp:Transcript_72597/g.143938  ORF Transcript_72597/g.143938 Transcript_72597/m.143938 type:complete len:123 (+) Transcript_72597:307-675(+)
MYSHPAQRRAAYQFMARCILPVIAGLATVMGFIVKSLNPFMPSGIRKHHCPIFWRKKVIDNIHMVSSIQRTESWISVVYHVAGFIVESHFHWHGKIFLHFRCAFNILRDAERLVFSSASLRS